MATNKEIKAYVKQHFGFVPADCWIAHARGAKRADGSVDHSLDISSPTRACSERKRDIVLASMLALGEI